MARGSSAAAPSQPQQSQPWWSSAATFGGGTPPTVSRHGPGGKGRRVVVTDFGSNAFLRSHVDRIVLEIPPTVLTWTAVATDIAVHVYQLNADDPAADEEGEEEEGGPAFTVWELPSESLEGMWESLHFEGDCKEELLAYVETGLSLSDRGVSRHLVGWNGVVLLHGPPGGGKTSLAQALAQKLSIRMGGRHESAELVAVNTHSLFSKWFSESGKLVSRMFARIREIAEDERTLVVVLVDEVESLSAARKNAAAGSEPSDAIRVVNALLTQLDLLKSLRNVVTVATSNITEAIDAAFVDRADIKMLIPSPGVAARFEILASAVDELVRVGVVVTAVGGSLMAMANVDEDEGAKQLLEIATKCDGMSGRVLRKLPFLAISLFLPHSIAQFAMPRFLTALASAAARETQSRSQIATL